MRISILLIITHIYLITQAFSFSVGSYEMRFESSQHFIVRVCIREFRYIIPKDGSCMIGQNVTVLKPNAPVFLNFPFSIWQENITVVVEVMDGLGARLADNVWRGRTVNNLTSDFDSIWTTENIRVSHRVKCNTNFHGALCNNFCEENDGFHYSCGSNGERICHTGWSGPGCRQAVCDGGCGKGICEQPGSCKCPHGFQGSNCEECVPSSDCMHGGCDQNRPFTCKCHSDWTGKSCDQDRHYCVRHQPCKNGGTCVNGIVNLRGNLSSEFSCMCPTGFGGTYCERKTTDHVCTDGTVCHNGGKCSNISGQTVCQCKAHFSGRRCEFDSRNPCAANPCRNNGVCTPFKESYVCSCQKCFSGHNCDILQGECYGPEAKEPSFLAALIASIGMLIVALAIAAMLIVSYYKMKRLVASPEAQNSVNERRPRLSSPPVYQICVDKSNIAPPPYKRCEDDELV